VFFADLYDDECPRTEAEDSEDDDDEREADPSDDATAAVPDRLFESPMAASPNLQSTPLRAFMFALTLWAYVYRLSESALNALFIILGVFLAAFAWLYDREGPPFFWASPLQNAFMLCVRAVTICMILFPPASIDPLILPAQSAAPIALLQGQNVVVLDCSQIRCSHV
jgi:hypothetical protein